MRVLIIKTSSLGDIIQTFPVLEYLKSHFSGIQIDWVVEKPFAGVVQSHSFVERVLTIETKKWRRQGIFNRETVREVKSVIEIVRKEVYDIVFDLQGNIKSGLVTLFAYSSFKVGFGHASVPECPNIVFTSYRFNPPKGQNIRDDYLFIVEAALKKFKGERIGDDLCQVSPPMKINPGEEVKLRVTLADPRLSNRTKIMVCAGSNWVNKRLSNETLVEFLKLVEGELKSSFLFIWGGDEERLTAEVLHSQFPDTSLVVDKVTLPALQNLMAQVDLVISMDSLPLHLAATTSTPTYSVFGPSSSQKYKPPGEQHGSFQGSCPYGKKFEKRCPILRSCKTGSCVKDIEPRELLGHFNGWISQSYKKKE
jgi:heptosyltransferase-1